MDFAELISTIMREKSFTIEEMAKELDLSVSYLRKIVNHTFAKPLPYACAKIMEYCQNNNLTEYHLDWNQVLYDFLNENKCGKEYSWIEDIDTNGNVRLLHKKCKRITAVPMKSFTLKTSFCIHCWIEKNCANRPYVIHPNSYTSEYKVDCKRCGRTYTVSYDQLKKGQYICDACNPKAFTKEDSEDIISLEEYESFDIFDVCSTDVSDIDGDGNSTKAFYDALFEVMLKYGTITKEQKEKMLSIVDKHTNNDTK